MFGFRKNTPEAPGNVEYIIAGLGNPGNKYDGTRHNAGFIVLDALADKLGVRISKLKFKSLCCTATLGGHKVLLLKPSTFMNLSGQAVTEAMAFFKVPPENTIIVFDDISLDPGKLRIRRKGSDGGHNGMKNIIYLSASDTFPRIKVGVGAKPHPDYNLADWVLSRFTEDEVPLIKEAAENACQALELMVQGKTDVAMNRFN
ncbi:MAG: aminoacyl-tRNA hydrolase [Clostridia bacterium]|nr:aminoacyl-tRNA hydrolase [Clostridia bacterium]